MKPLRETEAQSPLLRQARALLESTEPLPESRERMLRVRRALDQRKRGGVLGRVPAAVMAGVIVLFGASAFAAVRYIADRSAAEERAVEHARSGQARVQARTPAEAVANAQPTASDDAARDDAARRGGFQNRPLPAARTTADERPRARVTPRAPRSRHAAAKARPTELRPTPVAQAPTAVPAASPTSSGASAAPAAPAAPAAKPALASATEPEPAAPEQEPRARIEEPAAPPIAKDGELVHRALQALRRQDDPALAARLLAQHRQKQPSGALAEEALSLQIEAAVALEDPRALMFAREYLARYPHGRYVRVARKALAGGR